ncbi:hypothetical protein GCM10020358_74070 [Amorphoplanes nipponensis]|uniref:Uncharacterized protein n=1 Tax=Actinoplanes nipponensis TaxID=135950 RepID=A0A919JHN9_9ACTN|nr:hypothetical protein [Actinoplanes nipponensis]GIE49823.1 hypothetical protein Ani05nite_33570 [Actinoplanes nipponensis]
MNTATDLILIGALAGVWLTAGLLADALPGVRTARELRRRARTLSLLVGAGVAVFIAVPLVTGVLPGTSNAPAAALLPAVPALVVLTLTARRLTRIRRGAAAFATAPLTPAPPALQAAAAHPLVATPLQVTGLAALAGVPIAAGVIDVPGAQVAGIVLTVVGMAVLALGIRHAIRHSRLNVNVFAPIGKARLRPVPARQTAAETYTALPAESRPAEGYATSGHRAA